ncbi:MAG: FHA domain-containing protein [Oscillospiraceae bacterium]|nr:FHA domain-containing protein [Oscillospiraceae bacterium]
MLGNNFKLKTIYQNEKTFLVLSMKKKEQINESLLQTLKKDNNYSLLSAAWTKSGTINKLTYEISNLVCLSEYIKTPLSQDKYFDIISQIQQIYEKCCKATMPINNLICQTKYTFYDPVSSRIYMAYAPIINGNYSSNIVKFLHDINKNSSIIASDGNFLNSYNEFLEKHIFIQKKNKDKNSSFSYNDLYNFLHEKDTSKNFPERKNEKRDIPQSSPNEHVTQPVFAEETNKTVPIIPVEAPSSITNHSISSATVKIQRNVGELFITDKYGQKHIIDRFPFKIGRNEANNLVINDPCVSGFHAEIISQGKEYYINDTNSANGTFVNGKEITSELLTDGTTFLINDFPLTFHKSAVQPGIRGEITQTCIIQPQRTANDYVAYMREETTGNILYINDFPFSHPSLEGMSIIKIQKDICIKNNSCESLFLETETIPINSAYSLYSGCCVTINNNKYIFYIKS